MHATTGYWTRAHWQETERKEQKRRDESAKRLRSAHRAKPAEVRLVADLEAVRVKLVRALDARVVDVPRTLRLLRQWNRVVKLLNNFCGASQQVPLAEV